jgi:thiamine biosynthesis lipoprotein
MPGAQAQRPPAAAHWDALGTHVSTLVARPDDLPRARDIVEAQLRALDEACSRFRDDSELARLNAADGKVVHVSELLLDAVAAGVRAAELTEGEVDPTLGDALELAGYDRDFAELTPIGDAPLTTRPSVRVRRRPQWRAIQLDRQRRTIRLPGGVRVDLGATAKALAADQAALAAWEATGGGVLVNLGGDIRVAGPPPDGGWQVRVTDEPGAGSDESGQTVAIQAGGVATSSTTSRRWLHAGQGKHHILDPANGEPARAVWRAVSVAAASCLDANTASTAAVVRGERAPAWLEELHLPSRLVAADGSVVRVGAWPEAQG